MALDGYVTICYGRDFEGTEYRLQRIYPFWSALLAIVIVATSIYGGYHYFSPIPFWDQWNGYIGFYHAIVDGDYKFFWSQHMDHRIVLPRVLFFIDIYLFGGRNIFGIVAIYSMLAFLGIAIWLEYKKWHTARYSPLLILGLIFSFLFSWIQNENLKWAFQSQFVAIYLFGMLAFACYSRPTGNVGRVALGIFFCVCAELSMGNGIATFFVMATQGILLRRSWREIAVVLATGIVATAVYFYHFVKPGLPIDQSIAHDSLARVKFFLIFLGNPVYWVHNSLALAGTAGALLFGFAAITTVHLYRKRLFTPYRSFLIAGYGLVVASAVGAAQGRWMLGLPAAVASRYSLPALLAFLVLSLLAIDLATTRRARTLVVLVPLVFLTFLARFQENVNGDIDLLFRWKLAVLSQKIGLDHKELDGAIFPLDVHYVYEREANFAAAREIGPYSHGWLHDAGIVKFDKALVDGSRCDGFLESVTPDSVGMVASGWVASKIHRNESRLIVLVNPAGETVGYGVSGRMRPDVKANQKDAPKDSGWSGFAKPGEKDLTAYALIGDRFCPLQTIHQ